MERPQPETVTLDDILITEELSQRSPRPPNLLSENQALHTLARQLVNQPETILQSLVDIALDLCYAGTAGVSLLETTPNGEELFRWKVLAGALAQYVGGTTPRNFSPCAVCLDRGTSVLFSHPDRYFTYFQEANTPIVEGLVLPLIADNRALGTIWIMSHDEQRHFDSEDVRVMTSLADFTATALLLQQRQTRELLAANAALETEIAERKRTETNLAFLAEISQDLVHLTNIDETMDAIGAKIGGHFNVACVIFSEISEDQETGRISHEWHQPDLPDMKGTYTTKDYFSPEFERLHRAGEIAVVHDTAKDQRVDRARYVALGVGAFVGVPLIRQDKWRFYFSLLDSEPRNWRDDEIELMRELTTRIWTRLERARAEEALTQSEAKYRSLFNSIDEGYALLELIYDETGRAIDWRLLEVNPSFERLTGFVDPVGKTGLELNPIVESSWLELFANVAQTGEAVRFEQYVESIDYWFDIYASRLDADKCHIVVVFNNITDRKRSEEQLRRAAEIDAFRVKLSDALRSLGDPAEIQYQAACVLGKHLGTDRAYYVEIVEVRAEFVVNRDWHQPGAPSHARRYPLEGWPMPWLVDGQPWVVRDVDSDPAMPDDQRESYRGNDIGALIVVPLVKNGRLVATLATNQHTPRAWTTDEIALVQETAERTWAAVERARAEAALRESEQRLSVIFAQAAVGLSEISLEGRFLQVNDALCRMLGRSREELLAASVPDVTHPNDLPSSLEAFTQLIETGEPVSLDKRYLRPDGTIVWANSILTRLDDEQGRPSNVLAVTVDLSDRKQAKEDRIQLIQEQAACEEERQRAESLAELDRAKTIFFSNVSHEFRTPLTLLLAPLQDALSDCATAQPSDRTHPLAQSHRERLELAHRNAIRLLKLVNTLLDFSRIEAGRMEAVYEPTDLALFTTELASVFRSAIERAGLRLIVDCPPLPEPVYVDRQMWEKIVLNLLSNAFKFTLEGEIAVRLHPADDHHVTLQVQDTGTGILPEELPHVFERFYQVRRTKARTHEGSGIGLALVHELIRLHGGTVDVSSTVGQGSCFTITIPLGTAHLPSVSVSDSEALASLRASAGRDSARRLRLDVGDSPSPFRAASPTETLRERITATRTLASTALGAAPYVEEAERWLPPESAEFRPPSPPILGGTGVQSSPILEGTGVQSPPSLGDLGGEKDLRVHGSPASPVSPTRVLLVDDNADMREYLTRILSEHVQVEAVADGASALTVAQERVPDLVLTDVMMPGVNGFELLQALRANPRTREIPIILLSARAGEESVVEGLEAGADDYLIKPFSAQELVSRVNAHLQMAQLRLEALHEERTINRRKDELLSTVSHELNTPLVAILGWTRLLRANPPSQAMLVKALETIERNATIQAKLVQDLLDMSRITAGKLRLRLEPVELESVIEMAIASISHLAQAKQIDLVWRGVTGQKSNPLAPGNVDQVLVQGDRDRLQQIITNLLTNAIKFNPNQGSINVELSVIEVQNSPNASYAEISITDTGIGISAEFIPHVFDRFRQAEESRSSKGLGLGLAIARHLVELHNGTIRAESAGVGQGATFIVRLPLMQQ